MDVSFPLLTYVNKYTVKLLKYILFINIKVYDYE